MCWCARERADQPGRLSPDLEAGALGSVYNFVDPRLRHNFEVVHNVLRDECSTALKQFFGELRRARREGSP